MDAQTATRMNVENKGVIIQSVIAGSPAAKAGITTGDIIVKADGQDVESPDSLQSMVKSKNVGDTMELEIVRSGQTETIKVVLEEKPAETSRQP